MELNYTLFTLDETEGKRSGLIEEYTSEQT